MLVRIVICTHLLKWVSFASYAVFRGETDARLAYYELALCSQLVRGSLLALRHLALNATAYCYRNAGSLLTGQTVCQLLSGAWRGLAGFGYRVAASAFEHTPRR